ncbi:MULTISPECIES: CDP-diacylglycerol--glycerol-3-phosphate 3-phosphatidyltransferase [unclassified Meridianimarinicoccus]|uniref:CDP-diacylglycerol--glycerol-3-phosphate 3-phosphatidyltransferase n=1 Tax=unclassified Meridianimarinicoccus TaxID=2923344 RepID=UPI0018684132|nr:CDP-diacylglycerol--glycerol-3-phosphate 3-phosphatidyltransferase [Fluviibacterium sp. MJW13]
MTWNIPNILTVMRLFAAPCVALIFMVLPRPMADWAALVIFVLAAVTDWFDGYLARKLNQQTRFGAMLDPIADKAMVIISICVILALSGLDPWLTLPAVVILFREVFVSGLREFLGSDASLLQVTKLAKWKTTAQMVAIPLLLLSLGLQEVHFWLYRSMDPADYGALLAQGPQDWNATWRVVQGGWLSGLSGLVMFYVAAFLTGLTGLDYYRKSLRFLEDEAGDDAA